MTARAWLLISVAIFALLTQPYAVRTQTADDWAKVFAVETGTNIRVETRAGRKVEGQLVSVSQTEISVSSNSGTEKVAADDVKKVYRFEKGFSAKGVAIGAAIGAGLGAGVGGVLLASTGGSDDTGGVIAPFIAIGAGLGALAGAAFKSKKRTLVFEAK